MDSISPNGTKQHYNRGIVEGSWKGMKKYLEQDMLCKSLWGRVVYHYDVYPKFGSSSACFTVILDDAVIKKFGLMYVIGQMKQQGRLAEKQYLWDIPMSERDEYEDSEFSEALKAYRNQPIAESLASPNPIQRMFAIVDRRVGKRTLQQLCNSVREQPEWLRPFYEARLTAEGIPF